MQCPFCAQPMALGYLRGERSYELMWTDDPFKATNLATGTDERLCKPTELDKPKAHYCRACRRIVLDLADRQGF